MNVARGNNQETPYVVESGVPIPVTRPGRRLGDASRSKYPFAQMGIGDSFAFGEDEAPRVHTAAGHHAKRYRATGIRFFVSYAHRRCWRVA